MEKNVKPKKKIGQHFLSDDNIAKKIIDLVNFKNHRHIVEVGPGMGVNGYILAIISMHKLLKNENW